MTLQNRGLVKLGAGLAEVQSIPIPKLRDDYILVKTVAVALNPTDWQGLDDPFKPGATRAVLGCDYSGIVVEVGKAVKKKFKQGDRIAGISHGGNDFESEDGTFAEYIMVKGDIQFHIPPNISFEEAAALGCGVTTVALGFTKYLELPFMSKLKALLSDSPTDNQEGPPILIYGGSSATGTIAIQFAKLLGLTVITTSSPRNFELLRSLGADHVLDYHDPDCAQKIRSLTNNSLNQVFDTIATPEAAKICAESLSPNLANGKGKYVCLLSIELPREDIKSIFFLGYTAMGEAFWFEGETWDICREDFELAVEFFGVLEGLLERGLVRSHPVALREGGLEKISEGMGDLKKGVVSGVKLVYLIGEA